MERILTIIVAVFCLQVAFAQSAPVLPKEVKVGKPAILKPAHGTYKKSDLMKEFAPGSKWGTKTTVKEFWKVYSDRNHNQLYADASLTQKLRVNEKPATLAFGQPVVIAEVKGDAALVYDDSKIERYPIVPPYAKALGWIPMENLLLWDKCPTDERGVQYKALIARNLNEIAGKEFKEKVYLSPTEMKDSKALAMDFDMYFIMKETSDGSRVLLCKNASIFGSNLYGWIDEDVFFNWHQRACIEPNWNPEYVDNHRGHTVGVYGDEQLSAENRVINWEFGCPNGYDDTGKIYRMSPFQFRFPIVDGIIENNNCIHCLVILDQLSHFQVDSTYLEHYIGKSGYQKFIKIKTATIFEGYTPLIDSGGEPYWRYVVFLSDMELKKLLSDLKPVYLAAKNQSDNRKPYVEAMKTLLKTYLGENAPKIIDLMSLGEIQEVIYGLNIHSKLMDQLKLKDIKASHIVSNIEYEELMSKFIENYEHLQSFQNSGYHYRVKKGLNYFYWIPLEDLPL